VADGHRARAEAASRLPPLADGRVDPMQPEACYICGARPDRSELARLFGKLMCRDRVACYQRSQKGHQ
jgi:hypothetical protein